jgi:predicted DNA-binding transcriptional regulator YafY
VEACNDALLDIDPGSTGIRKRQVYMDINFMRDSKGYDAPIESFRDGQKTFYRYTDPNFSINSQPLNEQEAQQLKESILTLSRFKGLPQFDWVEEMKARLEQTFKLKTEENILSFDENQYLKGRERIGELYNAIVNKQVLKITYKSFKKEEEIVYQLSPYHLKQYNNRWFLFGNNHGHEGITNLAIDRIQKIEHSKLVFTPNTEIDFSEYFEDVIGVSVDPEAKTERIMLKVTLEQHPYIVSKPIHGSQRVKEINEDHSIIELNVQLNFELKSVLLSLGESIEVLEPAKLREMIRDKLEKLNQKYLICAE